MPTLSHVKEEPGAPSPGQDSCKGGRSMCRRRVGQRSVARFLIIVVLLSLSVLGGTGLPAYAEARDGLSCNPWSRVTSPGACTSGSDLGEVAVDPSGEIWAVGTYFNPAHNREQTLVERGNGSNWQVVPSPNAGIDNNDLHGVAVELSGNAWAVGSYFDPRTGSSRTLIERWNGSNWNIMPSPNVGTRDSRLSGATVDLSRRTW